MPKRPARDSGTRLAEELRAIPLPSEPPERALAAAALDDDGPEPSRPARPEGAPRRRRFAAPAAPPASGVASHRGT